jgi:NADH:ubiquinone oxidoreductase subunit 4 (subunit M)
MLPLLVGILWLGLYPGPVLRRMESASQRYLQLVGASAPAMAEATRPAAEARP